MKSRGQAARGHRMAVALGARLLRVAIGALGSSCRVQRPNAEEITALRARQGPAILVLWHRQLFLCCYLLHRELTRHGVPLTALVSGSRDGDFGARVAVLLRARIVRGSSSRGGGPALRQLAREVRGGSWPVMIPDGPRGPEGEAKGGAQALARLTGAPLIPLGLTADRYWRLRSWDRTLVPKPFARLAMAVGEPIHPGAETGDSPEGLAEALDAVEQRAASLLGSRFSSAL